MRSSKRIKLSPATDYTDEGPPPTPVPPERPNSRRDYVGESKNLMEKFAKRATFQPFQAMVPVASSTSPPRRILFAPPRPQVSVISSGNNKSLPSFQRVLTSLLIFTHLPYRQLQHSTNSKRSIYSSLGYRQQAADLMAQIKSDMKTTRRLFSSDTEAPT
jgi:hypothetical protein